MKKKISLCAAAMVSFVFMSFSALAQDPVKACPNIYKKVLLENEQVRVMEIEFKSGDAADWHTHPNHVAYALTDGKLEITDRGKETQTAEFKAGDAIYMGAVTHKAKNTGTNTVKMIVTEIKNDKKAGMK